MSKRIFRVALTGGIASGKTTVAEMFQDLGAVLIDTDLIARDVVEVGTPGLRQVVARFGRGILHADGALDRRALRRRVFSDDRERLDLEAILHPLIREGTERQMQTVSGDYQMIIVPLLIESPLRNSVNRILVVDCSEEVQLERLLGRDEETPQQARRMIAAQSDREDRLALADDVIQNDTGIDATLAQVTRLHQQYLALAEQIGT